MGVINLTRRRERKERCRSRAQRGWASSPEPSQRQWFRWPRKLWWMSGRVPLDTSWLQRTRLSLAASAADAARSEAAITQVSAGWASGASSSYPVSRRRSTVYKQSEWRRQHAAAGMVHFLLALCHSALTLVVIVWLYATFGNNLGSAHEFSKDLEESCGKCTNQHFSFKYFPK